ncbi:MAG: GGDEF domain-containing protein [Lachnospiraceae bacterium]|nr:GGDEF domain-containing protein [Lachnospiraceae bacterium]
MVEDNTEALIRTVREEGDSDAPEEQASLFVCHGRTISEYGLDGIQRIGRPSDDYMPDIPVFDRFVSRKHGILETTKKGTSYTVLETTNGVLFKGQIMKPGEKIFLSDGDELIFPSRSGKEGNSVILVFVSTEARRHLWQELRQASRDFLTGLQGRESFMIWWYQNCMKKDYASSALFIMDVDNFKLVNDLKGHEAGDAALKIVARELRSAVRYEGQVCRWGGDEFVGVVPGTVSQVTERLTDLGKKIESASDGEGIPISVSIGFVDVHISGDPYNVAKLVSCADSALYKTKQSGKRGVLGYEGHNVNI